MKFKSIFYLFFLSLFISGFAFAQNTKISNQKLLNKIFEKEGETYFKFNISSKNEINILTKIISIDNVKNNVVYAYANSKEFEKFLQLNYKYTILPHPGFKFKPKMRDKVDIKNIKDWDFYPTYEAYENMMYQFETDYPDICKVENICTLNSGRKLLIAKITDNVDTDEDEPEFLYTGQMHGDEIVCYILMLHMIDYLLSNYGVKPEVTDFVNNMEIWINPLANPDGTYHGGNNTVQGATRYNANWVDLNRNYPDPKDGPHPDGNAWQPETQAFMALADEHNFVMSANTHSGSELVNYPWDTWPRLHADNNWWIYVSREYADTAQAYSVSGYFTDQNNGITNGYEWYTINGGRQDYMNYFQHCREVTIEQSHTKMLAADQLINHWNYNYRSMLNYMQQCLYGIRGIVTDSTTGEPLRAKVFIQGHDQDSSCVYSALPLGDYHRPIFQGTYSLTFSVSGYYPKTINNIYVANRATTFLDVQLVSKSTGLSSINFVNSIKIFPNPCKSNLNLMYFSDIQRHCLIEIFNLSGKKIYTKNLMIKKGTNINYFDLSQLSKGIYLVKISFEKQKISRKIIIQ